MQKCWCKQFMGGQMFVSEGQRHTTGLRYCIMYIVFLTFFNVLSDICLFLYFISTVFYFFFKHKILLTTWNRSSWEPLPQPVPVPPWSTFLNDSSVLCPEPTGITLRKQAVPHCIMWVPGALAPPTVLLLTKCTSWANEPMRERGMSHTPTSWVTVFNEN